MGSRFVLHMNTPSTVSPFNLPTPSHRPFHFKYQKKNERKSSSTSFRLSCRNSKAEEEDFRSSSPYDLLGVGPNSSLDHIKAAFRAKVKEFHPDVCKSSKDSDAMIRHVIWAYEMLSKSHQSEASNWDNTDPFEKPECEAWELFINKAVCVGKGCPYSCVKRAPHVFSFSSMYGTAQAISQGRGDDYQVQLAIGQCPRSCIHYVTPSQRVILEELLESVLNSPFSSGEAAILDSLIAKAKFENNRYQKPNKKRSKVSTQYVDWF